MTAAERAALAEAREAEAQRAKRAQSTQSAPKPTQSAAPRQTAPKSAPAQKAPKAAQGSVPKSTNKNNTREYPRVAGTKPPIRRASPQAAQPAKESDTGEFPSYVRRGKGGYRPPKPKTQRITKRRKPLDPRVKAGIAAVATIVVILLILLLAGVRYTTVKMADGSELRFFGTVKDGVHRAAGSRLQTVSAAG